MPTSDEIERLHDKVLEAAKEAGAYVMDAVLDIGENHPPFVAIPGDEFPPLIAHVRPRIVYILKSAFDAEEEAETSSDIDDDGQVPVSPRLKRLLARWKQKDGVACRMGIAMVCDGVLHSAVVEADWLEDFEAELEQIEIEEAEKRAALQVEDDRKRQDELQGHVERLMADPRFSTGRVSRAKRITLAGSLFPELDGMSIRQVVDKAESEQWLSAGK